MFTLEIKPECHLVTAYLKDIIKVWEFEVEGQYILVPETY